MRTLWKTTVLEGKLFLREPGAPILTVLFPTAILLALGAIPVLREPSEEYDGARFVEFWAPTALVMGLGLIGLQHIPAAIATYREKGVLRRISTTPAHPATLLLAQLLVALAAATVATLLLVSSAWLLLDVPLPHHPLGFIAAFVVGFGAVLAIGMVIAALSPNARVASGIATFTWMVAMFFGGLFLPRIFFPEPLQRVGDFTPPGVQALQDAWSADPAVAAATGVASAGGPHLLQLAVMALIAVVAGALAARLFRWE